MNIDSLALWWLLVNHNEYSDIDCSHDDDMFYLYLHDLLKELESNDEFVVSRKRQMFYQALN